MEKKDFIPPVSSQHGATITLCVSSLVPIFLSSEFSLHQLLTVVFLFSGFMCVEILQGRIKRGVWKNKREKFWNFAYGVLVMVGAVSLLAYNPLFIKILPFLTLTGLLCLGLMFFRLERLVVSQFIVFSLFAMAGLLTFPADSLPETRTLLILWVVESIYFGLSTFTVKFRTGAIGEAPVLIYLAASLSILAFILPSGMFKTVFILFLAAKITIPVLVKERFRSIRLKKIGLFEFASSFFFLCMTGLLFTPV